MDFFANQLLPGMGLCPKSGPPHFEGFFEVLRKTNELIKQFKEIKKLHLRKTHLLRLERAHLFLLSIALLIKSLISFTQTCLIIIILIIDIMS